MLEYKFVYALELLARNAGRQLEPFLSCGVPSGDVEIPSDMVHHHNRLSLLSIWSAK